MSPQGSFEVRADQSSNDFRVVRWSHSSDRMNNITCKTVRRFPTRSEANRSLHAMARKMNAEVCDIGGNLTFDVPAPAAINSVES